MFLHFVWGHTQIVIQDGLRFIVVGCITISSSIIDCDFNPSQIFTSMKRKRPVQFDYVDSEDDNLEVKRCKY
jgi:hypothetical protein